MPAGLLLFGIDVFPIGDDVVDAGPEGHHYHHRHGDIGENMILTEGLEASEKHRLKEDHGDADHLRGGLYLAEPARRHDKPVLARYYKAERGHRHFAEDDDCRRPDEHGAQVCKALGHAVVTGRVCRAERKKRAPCPQAGP